MVASKANVSKSIAATKEHDNIYGKASRMATAFDNKAGHNCIGHNHIGHNHTGHNYIGHNYITPPSTTRPGVPSVGSRRPLGHNSLGHNYIGHHHIGRAYHRLDHVGRWAAVVGDRQGV